MINNCFYFFIRFLFGISICILGLTTLFNATILETFLNQNINNIQIKFFSKNFNISFFIDNSHNLIFFDAFLLISTGLLCLFEFKSSKIFGFFSFFIQILFLENILINFDSKQMLAISTFLSIFGGLLNL